MSRGQRIGLLAAAALIAVAAFLIARPEGSNDDDKSDVTRIELRKHEPVGGPKRLEVATDDQVRIVVTSDTPDEIHLHGYNLEREVAPGKAGRFEFKARLEGAFTMESHETENRVATIEVRPR